MDAEAVKRKPTNFAIAIPRLARKAAMMTRRLPSVIDRVLARSVEPFRWTSDPAWERHPETPGADRPRQKAERTVPSTAHAVRGIRVKEEVDPIVSDGSIPREIDGEGGRPPPP
jgi:hypothetical protein